MVDLIRCMGGNRCSHIPGTCTASNVEYQAKAKAQIEANTPPAAQADAELVEELARALASSDDFPVAAPVGDYARNARAILPILHRHRIEARRKALEDAAEKVRDVMVAQEWPPQDGDRQIDEVLDAIRAMIEGEG